MARRAGDLYPLTIAAIFIIVFSSMWAGVQYSRGDLIAEQPVDDREQQLRDELWSAVDRWRAARDIGPTQKAVRVITLAQRAAVALANGSSDAESVRKQIEPNSSSKVENECSQLAIHRTVTRSGWNDTDSGPAFERLAADVANETVSSIAETDRSILTGSGTFVHGLGVKISGDDIYVVYRSCIQRRLSP